MSVRLPTARRGIGLLNFASIDVVPELSLYQAPAPIYSSGFDQAAIDRAIAENEANGVDFELAELMAAEERDRLAALSQTQLRTRSLSLTGGASGASGTQNNEAPASIFTPTNLAIGAGLSLVLYLVIKAV
jgi:hypothetical protein